MIISAVVKRYLFGAGLLAALSLSAFITFKYINMTNTINELTIENKVLTDNNAALVLSVEELNKTIATIEHDYELVIQLNSKLQSDFQKTEKRVAELNDKLSKYDIGVLAQAKPKTISRIITNATNDSTRCFEIISGSPLTEDEINATKKSQANSICPDIANPNYIPI